ncbi:MAG: LPS export ABC transporter permease LptF [Proteobacteria bacterium]|nr:LPS export ABC transporter permease LptF [Pseudomonadota bacterium]
MLILRYLTRDILTHTLAVSFVLFLVVFAGRFIRYLAEAAVGSLTGDVLLPIMLFKLPGFLEMILPLGLFIGILLSLGRLYAESEMVVLKACGVGPARLALYVMVPALLVMLAVAVLAMHVAPDGSARAQVLLDNPRSAEGLHMLNEGRFRKQRGGSYVTYAERIDDSGLMHNIFVFERGEREADRAHVATFAREGEIILDEQSGRRYLELRGGSRYSGSPGKLMLEEVTFDLYGELIPESKNSLRRSGKVEAVPTATLMSSEDPKLRGALWWRLSLPLMVPTVALIALALSRTDARRGRYAKIGPAMLILLMYFLGLTQGRAVIESGSGPGLMIAVHGAMALLAVLLLNAERLRKVGKPVNAQV